MVRLHSLHRPIVLMLIAALVAGPVACAPAAMQPGSVGSLVQSDKARVTAPEVTAQDLEALVAGNTTFALNLYRALAAQDGAQDSNLFFSPYSISAALAMTYVGARGETAQQMSQTLQFLLAQERLHPAFNALDLELASRAADSVAGEKDPFRLHIASALWGRRDYAFLPAFLDTLSENYGAGMRVVDFARNPEAARKTINEWVSEQTEGKIEELLAPGAVDALTALVLTNAIYFNAKWADPFNEAFTDDGQFTTLDGTIVTVPLMRRSGSYAYAAGSLDGGVSYQAIELPYLGGKLAMDVIAPDEGQFAAFEESLDAARLQEIIAGLAHTTVRLELPKFEFSSSYDLAETLEALGMSLALSSNADFSGMSANDDLFISGVAHKAFVAVDEAGTEAAAATAVMMAGGAAPAEPMRFAVDRPFVFVIRDIPTGTILFVGRVANPAA